MVAIDEQGRRTTASWTVGLPLPDAHKIHPTQVYSTINALLLCLLLLLYDRYHTRDGQVFALMVSIYPITRFILEEIRIDESDVLATGMSISQNVSILLLVAVVGLWIYILRQPRKLAFSS